MSKKNFLYIGALHQLRFTVFIKKMTPNNCNIIIKNSQTKHLTDISQAIRKCNLKGAQVHGIIVTDPYMVSKYVSKLYGNDVHIKGDTNLKSYEGSLFEHNTSTISGKKYSIPVVVLQSPEQLTYSNKAKFVWEHMISKLYDKERWLTAPKMEWTLVDDDNSVELVRKFSEPSCILQGVDVETKLLEIDPSIANKDTYKGIPTAGMWYLGHARTGAGAKAKRLAYLAPILTCVGYTGIFRNAKTGVLTSHTIVIPITSTRMIGVMKRMNKTKAPKVMHNGRYDAMYFLRYGAPLHNWVYDTYGLMHCWYSELPRALFNVTAFTLRNHVYWKDESGSNLYEYNAKDCHATAWACLRMLQTMPDWAWDNYQGIFKQVFPCITCAVEGFKEDPVESKILWQKYQASIKEDQTWWDTVVTKHFNTNSPPQVKQLFQSILATGVKKCDKPTLKNIVHKHPMWRLFVDKLIATRESKKADSTYMNITLFADRVLYELDPFGTETGRYASKASSYWCGTQAQNMPDYTKSKFIADIGYELNAIDNAQSESRTTAYTTNDSKLIEAVEKARDFHVRNASLFFGISEDRLFELKELADPLFKKYRNKIGKKLNHGANYNMEANMMIIQMTVEGIIEAKHTLNLPGRWTLVEVAQYLLDCFDKAYPSIRSREEGGYHKQIIDEVAETGKLVTPDGWTRITFHTDPENNKKDMNVLVAFKPQSWSVRIINRAFFDAWLQYQIVEGKMRMKAQIHDELMWQNKPEDSEYLKAGVSKLMARPNEFLCPVTKETKTMIIPNDPCPSGTRWSDLEH